MTDKLFKIDDSQILKAVDLIYETFEFNKVPVSIGCNACLNLVLQLLVGAGLPIEKAFDLAEHFKECLLSIGGNASVKERPNEKPS